MLFNSLHFLYFFLPAILIVFWTLRSRNQRYLWLAATGYFFYSFWSIKFCGLMAFSTLVSFTAGIAMQLTRTPLQKKLCLVIPISIDLLLLAIFKYADFVFGAINQFFGANLPLLRVVLPVGISFYTFHTITYIVDCYRGVVTPTRNLFQFLCYVSLFPQLVAGPIVRFREVEADLEALDHPRRAEWFNIGWSFFVIGLAKKLCLADTVASVVDPMLKHYNDLSTPVAWMCALGYSYQLYFDFSGYSDMAAGLGYLLGVRLPQNFNSPYKALDLLDFWRRWHISLSSVLRDYLYIPLGGNRGGVFGTYRNLMVTMLLGGLWHGANWTFVFWGGYHGALLIGNRVAGANIDRLPVRVRRVATFLLVVIGWVFFRSDSFHMAAVWLKAMFVPSWNENRPFPGNFHSYPILVLATLFLGAALAHFGPNTFEITHNWGMRESSGLAALFLLCLWLLYAGRPTPFLYFQF
jgi:alginate O-acetyltransferase complex protein AlgI